VTTQPMLDFDRKTFSPEVAEKAKQEGMDCAALLKSDSLALARSACKMAALDRPDRTATADDAQAYLVKCGLEPLGNAAGSLFLSSEWEFTGTWRKSERVSNHGHKNRVWRLK
jgi:hypothetical protein